MLGLRGGQGVIAECVRLTEQDTATSLGSSFGDKAPILSRSVSECVCYQRCCEPLARTLGCGESVKLCAVVELGSAKTVLIEELLSATSTVREDGRAVGFVVGFFGAEFW